MSESANATGVLTQRCTLRFSDGESVTGLIQCADSHQSYPVLYAGAVHRLPFRFDDADPLLLRILFRSFARELDARFEEEVTGDRDSKQEGLVDNETDDLGDNHHWMTA